MKKNFYAICREYAKGKWDVIMDWNSEQLYVFDSREVAVKAFRQYKKYYPNDGARLMIRKNPFFGISLPHSIVR